MPQWRTSIDQGIVTTPSRLALSSRVRLLRSGRNLGMLGSEALLDDGMRAAPLSGRTMARCGLRMMPPYPSSPLSCRKAGFPRYGWKAGVSGGTFPKRRSA
jgi:hypothetical protein